MAGSHAIQPNRLGIAIVIGVAMLAGWPLLARLSRPEEPVATVAEFTRLLQAGDFHSLERARAFVAGHDHELAPEWGRLLNDPQPKIRAGACDALGSRHNAADLLLLLPRASDTEYTVRARAFGALSRFAGMSLPQKSTLPDRREDELLRWLVECDRTAPSPLAPQLCELYTRSTFLEFGKPLLARCLGCHVGNHPAPFASHAVCADCHPEIHAAWSRSAHANSTTHLHLQTVDPVTRQSQWIQFEETVGISCGECHARQPQAGTTTPATTQPGCRMGYRRAATDACARCHADVQRQWEQWRTGPQPREATWPPGEIDLEARGDERTCTGCHMLPVTTSDRTVADHRWAARRDLKLLQSGLNLQLQPALEGDGMQTRLMLTNLAGHAYPTGTCRRRLEISLGAGGAESPPLLTTLGTEYAGDVSPGLESPLRPGEQRTWSASLPDSSEPPVCRIRYVRSHDDPGLYSIDVYSNVPQTNPATEP